jgi:purine-binding chemotaxis protein CheW
LAAAESLTTQFLTFALGQDAFAVDVQIAREIVDYAEVTQVPQTPDYLLGVINLRGAVVPVIDMRLKFGMEEGATTQNSCIIVMDVDVNGDIATVGALVDSVQEVMDLNESQIEPPPKIGTKMNTEYIKGMGNMGEKFLILLDMNKIFSVDELELVQDLHSEEIEA